MQGHRDRAFEPASTINTQPRSCTQNCGQTEAAEQRPIPRHQIVANQKPRQDKNKDHERDHWQRHRPSHFRRPPRFDLRFTRKHQAINPRQTKGGYGIHNHHQRNRPGLD